MDEEQQRISADNGTKQSVLSPEQSPSGRWSYKRRDGNIIPIEYDTKVLPHISLGFKKELLPTADNPLTKELAEKIGAYGEKIVEESRSQTVESSEITLSELTSVGTLNLPDYIDLMKKLSGRFATHVMRFGVRTITSTKRYCHERLL